MRLLIAALLVMSGMVQAAPTVKYCIKGVVIGTKENGCYDGTKNVPYEEWLAKVEPNARFLKAEEAGSSRKSSSIIRIWFSWK